MLRKKRMTNGSTKSGYSASPFFKYFPKYSKTAYQACSERVLVQLCNQFSDIVVPLLAATFQQIGRKSFSMILNVYRSSLKMIAQPPADLNAVVQKEALYCAIGRCALRLKNVIQLDTWLNGPFNNEAHDSNPTYASVIYSRAL